MKGNIIPKLVRAWIEKGENDLSFARDALKETEYYDNICCLCQQAVEKYLKGFLVKSKGGIEKKEKIHDLPKLADLCKKFGLNLTGYYTQLRTLSETYIPTRYPDASFARFTKKDAQESLEAAEEIIKKIKEKLFK